MVSDPTIRTRIVELILENDPLAKAYRRRRWPVGNRIAEYMKLFVNDDKQLNGYMVRRLRRQALMKGIPGRLVAVQYDYGIRFYRGLHDYDDDTLATEEIAQATIDSLAAVFEADNTLGLGATVSHEGFQMPTDFEDIKFGDWLCHRADFRLRVTVMNTNCS